MNTENKGSMPDAELMARMIQAQFGSPEQSDAISKHMEEYFKRFPSYKHKFTNLEWYHIFLDFSDHLQQSPTDSEVGKLREENAELKLSIENATPEVRRAKEAMDKAGKLIEAQAEQIASLPSQLDTITRERDQYLEALKLAEIVMRNEGLPKSASALSRIINKHKH